MHIYTYIHIWAPLATLSHPRQIQDTDVSLQSTKWNGSHLLECSCKGLCHNSVPPVVTGLSSSSAYTTLKTIQTLFMCRSTMVEWPTERYPVYLQETLENPAPQRASPILALTLYFPTPSISALYLSVLSSMPALYLYSVTSDRVWLVGSFYIVYC